MRNARQLALYDGEENSSRSPDLDPSGLLHFPAQLFSDRFSPATDEDKAECPFCDIASAPPESSLLIAELDSGLLLLNHDQRYPGRSIFMAKRHAVFPDIEERHFLDFNVELLKVCRAIKKATRPDLVNVASLGNVVSHFHYHIIPRYRDDPNWGTPPWPYHRKSVSTEHYRKTIAMIRNALKNPE